MNKTLGKPTLITDKEEMSRIAGFSDEEVYKGILVYKGCYWIAVLDDGQYELMIDRSDYIGDNLSKLETILAKWVRNEEKHSCVS